MPLIIALERQRQQADLCEFKVYILSSRPGSAIETMFLKEEKTALFSKGIILKPQILFVILCCAESGRGQSSS